MTTGITAAAVGIALGVSADTVRRHWPQWSAARGFPRPLFDHGLLRWDAGLIEDWKRERSRPDQQVPALETDWASLARRRGAALDAGRDPELITA